MILLTLLVKYPFLEEYIKTLYPIPNDAYALTAYYYGYPETLVNGSDEKTIDRKCPDLIREICCYEGAVYLHDQDLQVQFGESVKNRYFNLVVSDRRREFANTDLRMKTYGDIDMSLYKGRKMMI